MESKPRAYSLILISLALIVLSQYYLPTVSLIAFVPLFWLLEKTTEQKLGYVTWFFGVFSIFTLHAFLQLQDLISIVIYAIGLSLAVSLYVITNSVSKNRLGLFTILIFWLGFDYLILKTLPEASQVFISSYFDGSTAVRWSRSTGNMGITVWILLSNLLMYYVFLWEDAVFKNQMRWLSFSYSIILIAIPVVISLYFTSDQTPITLAEVQGVYAYDDKVVGANYKENGEWLGRTTAWVSVMIIVYTAVKRKVK